MLAGRVGPETEPVVMLGGEDYATEAGRLGGCGPLIAVERCGVENILRLSALTPLFAREGVWTEMTEHIHLHLLPSQLRRRRSRAEGFRRKILSLGRTHKAKQNKNPPYLELFQHIIIV